MGCWGTLGWASLITMGPATADEVVKNRAIIRAAKIVFNRVILNSLTPVCKNVRKAIKVGFRAVPIHTSKTGTAYLLCRRCVEFNPLYRPDSRSYHRIREGGVAVPSPLGDGHGRGDFHGPNMRYTLLL